MKHGSIQDFRSFLIRQFNPTQKQLASVLDAASKSDAELQRLWISARGAVESDTPSAHQRFLENYADSTASKFKDESWPDERSGGNYHKL